MKSELIVLYSLMNSQNEMQIFRTHQVKEVFDNQGPIDPQIIEQAASRFLPEEKLDCDPSHPCFEDMDLLKSFALECAEAMNSDGVRLLTNEEMNQIILSSNQTSELIEAMGKTGERSENSNSKNNKGIWGKLFN